MHVNACSVVSNCLPHCSPSGSPVHGISQARTWSGLPFPSPGNLPNPGIKPTSLALEGFFPTESPAKPQNQCTKRLKKEKTTLMIGVLKNISSFIFSVLHINAAFSLPFICKSFSLFKSYFKPHLQGALHRSFTSPLSLI